MVNNLQVLETRLGLTSGDHKTATCGQDHGGIENLEIHSPLNDIEDLAIC